MNVVGVKPKRKTLPFILISLLFHLLLFLTFVSFRPNQPAKVTPPPDETSYYYEEPPPSPAQSAATLSQTSSSIPTYLKGETESQQGDIQMHRETEKRKETLEKTAENNNWLPTAPKKRHRETKALKMIGEKLLDDPLRKLLGYAITAHLYYPEIARALFLHGTVGIGFVLHPDGEITGAHIVATSKEKILDAVALEAVNSASPIKNVDVYIKEPRPMRINIIF